MLNTFIEAVNQVITNHHELNQMLPTLKLLLSEFLAKDAFRMNCIRHLLNTIDVWQDSERPWNAPSIYDDPKLNYSIRIIFWPGFYENNPHQHKTWGVTGVFYNHLHINIYEHLDYPKRLKLTHRIHAIDGEAGYLLPGCIHNIQNSSHEVSASIHIFHHHAGSNHGEENAIWYPSPKKHQLSLGLIDRALSICLHVLAEIRNTMEIDLIKKIYAQNTTEYIKFNAIKLMNRYDRALALEWLNQLKNNL